MISREEALRKMEERARKRKNKKSGVGPSAPSPNVRVQGAKEKIPKPSSGMGKSGSKKKKTVLISDESPTHPVQFLVATSICSTPQEFNEVFPQLLFGGDRAAFEKLGESEVLERGAQTDFAVSICPTGFVLV